jgi:hypothetical protein
MIVLTYDLGVPVRRVLTATGPTLADARIISMTQDHGRYGREKLSPFERHLAESADRHAFTSPVWASSGGLTDEQLVAHVAEAIAEYGSWSVWGS